MCPYCAQFHGWKDKIHVIALMEFSLTMEIRHPYTET